MAVALTGCMSMAFKSDLVPGTTPAPAVGTAKFHIADVKVSTTGKSHEPPWWKGRKPTNADLSSEAVSARPNLFSDDFSAVSLFLKVDYEYSNWYTESSGANFTVSITAPAMEGDESLGSVAFKWRAVMSTKTTGIWVIPVATLEAPDSDAAYVAIAQKFTNAVCIEAVVKALGQCDAGQLAKLQALYDSRTARIQSLSLDGKPCWGFVGFGSSKPGASSGPRDVAVLSIWTKAPTYKTFPADQVVVALRGEDGRWRPCNGYLRTSQTLTAASVLLENGKPGRVVLRPVEEPEIDDFIDLPVVAEKDRAESIRWSNGVLLQVRNRSMPRLVRERSGTELLDLVTRLEKVALTLDEVREKHKDRAKQLVEQGTGDPAPDREMAILYGLRQEVFRAILATIRQEAARKRP